MFTIASEKIKYLGVSLAEEMKALFAERYKTLMKTIEVTNRKVFCAHGLEELVSVPPKEINRFSAIPIKISISFLTEIEQSYYRVILKFLQIHRRP